MSMWSAVAMVAAGLAGAAPASAAAAASYRTDAQAERYLEHRLRGWAGINLRGPRVLKDAFCINGYYSRHEQRTRRHYKQGRVNRHGGDVFRSFACTFVANNRTFGLYLVAKQDGWLVAADH